jgi:hypothetical protein
MLGRWVMFAIVALAMPFHAAEAYKCASYSSVSRLCFFDVWKPCKAKGGSDAKCHKRAAGCRTCIGIMFTCWKTIQSRDQCGTCSAKSNTCMKGVLGANDCRPVLSPLRNPTQRLRFEMPGFARGLSPTYGDGM